MARNDKVRSFRSDRSMQKLALGISDTMDSIYRSTYMATPQQSNTLKGLSDEINAHIDNIVNRNMDSKGLPSVSSLYTRIADTNKANGASKIVDSLETMFDSGILGTDIHEAYMANRFLRELDTEIDTVCKYMPSLEEALDVQKDCVLSADHFSKDFLNFTHPGHGVDSTLFSERVKDLKKKYKLAQLVEDIYSDTSKYGEKFIYKVPFNTAIGRLLASKPDSSLVPPLNAGINESNIAPQNEQFLLSMSGASFAITNVGNGDCYFSESAVLMEQSETGKGDSKIVAKSILDEKESFNIGVEICTSNIIESVVIAHRDAIKKREIDSTKSMAYMHETTAKKDIKASGNISLGSNPTDERIIQANDGLIAGGKVEPVKVNAIGCVVKELERDHVMPIYIDDLCMGYYYFEVRTMDKSENMMGFKNLLGDPLTNLKGGESSNAFNAVDNSRQDNVIKYIAGQLSRFIDKKFVNNNQDLSREIYMILKYNDIFNAPSVDLIKVTFIPPEDMIHFYFNFDKRLHRGVSDLAKSLIPAKIWSSLYITDSIAHLTRGQDKRVYYVKQTVDTNIAQTLLNTIAQIKQSNFGIRQFQNINAVLNITGRFNDYVIPTNASGEPPVQFEVMPGQDIKTPTDLMESLERVAVNATGIPYEIIQTRNSVDYAMQLTMSSSKVLRWCYKRQELYQDMLSTLCTDLYNYEYNDSVEIKVTLPPPGFINVTNTNQLVDNTRTFVQSLVEIELGANGNSEEDDKLKAEYTKALFNHYIGTHIDASAHKDILEKCKLKVRSESDEGHSDNTGENDY